MLSVIQSLRHHPEYFFNCRVSLHALKYAVFQHGEHTFFFCLRFNVRGCPSFDDELSDRLCYFHHFMNANSTQKPIGSVCRGSWPIKSDFLPYCGLGNYFPRFKRLKNALHVDRLAKSRDASFIQKIFFLSVAKLSYETLGNDNIHRGNNKKRLDFHIDKARNGPGGRIRMER